MTTRLCPRVLESADGKLLKGCREAPLAAFSPEDAVTYFHNEGIKATRAEVSEACAAYGYHPLSLSLLVGLINADHERRGDIAAVKNLEIFADVKARRHHVLERAYESLAPERRDLLSKIACFRGSMEYATIKKVFDNPVLENSLIDLRQRGLLQYVEETKRYDLHPIVRRFAYDRLNAVDRAGVHARLVNYFEAIPKPQKVNTLEDLAPVIESYYHIARVGKFDEAATIYYKELQDRVYFQFNSHQLGIELLLILFPEGDDKLPHIDRSDKQAYILNELGRLYGRVGQPDKAILFYSAGNKVIGNTRLSMFNERANLETKISYANGMSGLASQERAIGNLTTAGNLLYHSINLCSEINDQLAQLLEAMHRSKLGHLLLYFGMWSVAFQELKKALEQLEILNHVQAQGVTWSDISFFYLLYDRSTIKKDSENIKFAIEASKQALKLADEDARTDSPTPRDYVRAYWLLGSAYRANNELTLAEENLSKALDLCRQINAVETEAEILLDVARLRYAQGDFKDAQEKASEALMITERSGYVLQRADVNLFLAQYALEQEQDKAKAKQYAETALKLAYCDGPPFYYKVAYEEAERMLEKLGSA